MKVFNYLPLLYITPKDILGFANHWQTQFYPTKLATTTEGQVVLLLMLSDTASSWL